MSARARNRSDEPDVVPEADRLEGFAHPRETEKLLGQAAAEAEFMAALDAERAHHAWLLQGPEGVGKATLAYRIARFLLAPPQEREPSLLGPAELGLVPGSRTARQVAALSHPGLFVIRRPWDQQRKRFATAITVDRVRKLRSFLTLSADAGAWRVVIVDRADELNINAANALLKSLEEPPKRCLFMLIASEPGRLLTTIRSRCRRLDLVALDQVDLKAAVGAACQVSGVAPPGDGDWGLLETLSGGSVRQALMLSQGDGLATYTRLIGILNGLPDLDRGSAIAMADELSGVGGDQRYEMFFELLGNLIVRLVRHVAKGGNVENDEAVLARRLIQGDRVAHWASLWETIHREKADVDLLNLDRRTLVLTTLLRLDAASRQMA